MAAADYTTTDTLFDELVLTDVTQRSQIIDRLSRCITDASRAIDAFCRVPPGTFQLQTLTKTFDVHRPSGRGSYSTRNAGLITDNTRVISMQGVSLPPLATIVGSGVRSDEDSDGVFETVWSDTTDYLLYPLNDEVKREIRPNPYTGRYAFPIGMHTLQIQADWGIVEDGITPSPIRRATILESLRYYRNSDSTGNTTNHSSLGGAWANFGGIDPDVAAILRTVAGRYLLQYVAV